MTDNEVRMLWLGLLITVVGLLYVFGIIPAAAQYGGGFGPYGPYGAPPPGAYDPPPCNPYYNPDCGRFRWEGQRSRNFRCELNPFMGDCPRGPGAPYEGPAPWRDDE